MKTLLSLLLCACVGGLILALGGVGCSGGGTISPNDPGTSQARPSSEPGTEHSPTSKESSVEQTRLKLPPGVKRGKIGEHVWLETQGDVRRVRVDAQVCPHQWSYGLEFLLSKKFKDYESVMTTEADALVIHKALVIAKAEAGHPARFDPAYAPPTGSVIKISLEYEADGKLKTVPAQSWIRNAQTKKEEDLAWVFAGSRLFADSEGEDKPKIYAANTDGAYICMINLPTALLDVTVHSPKGLEGRSFEPFAERIPPEKTQVTVILEPVPDKEK